MFNPKRDSLHDLQRALADEARRIASADKPAASSIRIAPHEPADMCGTSVHSELVDRLADLKRQFAEAEKTGKRIRAEIEVVEAAIVEYATSAATSEVDGSMHRAKLVTESSVHFPTKERDLAGYAELDRLLRGSPSWHEVSCFDRHRLLRIVMGGEPDPASITQIVGPFVETRYTTRVVVLPRGGLRDGS